MPLPGKIVSTGIILVLIAIVVIAILTLLSPGTCTLNSDIINSI